MPENPQWHLKTYRASSEVLRWSHFQRCLSPRRPDSFSRTSNGNLVAEAQKERRRDSRLKRSQASAFRKLAVLKNAIEKPQLNVDWRALSTTCSFTGEQDFRNPLQEMPVDVCVDQKRASNPRKSCSSSNKRIYRTKISTCS
ncbi:hypothetical protein SKAU_G00299440 [Synaphobranchus kaupii]|uniref:Uncharacterized protein n=1 Tax=Synaphobranchus kaupii TaxID=118154 RepID=A0A9Q1EVF8_SYNKA|nr:hypothetical protein SKAU_G00299440 [Synaphobranchus kaupii]